MTICWNCSPWTILAVLRLEVCIGTSVPSGKFILVKEVSIKKGNGNMVQWKQWNTILLFCLWSLVLDKIRFPLYLGLCSHCHVKVTQIRFFFVFMWQIRSFHGYVNTKTWPFQIRFESRFMWLFSCTQVLSAVIISKHGAMSMCAALLSVC